MLFFIIGCGAIELPVTAFQDEAGYLVAQMGTKGCDELRPCRVWDTGRFATGPQQVVVGRPCPDGCLTSEEDRRVFGARFDGVVGVVARDNPLYTTLEAFACNGREACDAWLDGDALVIVERANGQQSRVLMTD